MARLLTTTRYNEIINYFANKAAPVIPNVPIFKTPNYFASPQDFAARVNETSIFDKGYKVRYAMFGFSAFQDSRTKGCDEDPNTKLIFTLQLYRSVQQEKTGQDNSHDLLVYDMINLRNTFLVARTIEVHSIEHDGLVQIGEMTKAQQCQYIAEGSIGNWINFQIGVEINAD